MSSIPKRRNVWMMDHHIGERLRDAREACRMTRWQVGMHGIVNNNTLSCYEHNVVAIPLDRLIMLCKLYKADVNDILEEALWDD